MAQLKPIERPALQIAVEQLVTRLVTEALPEMAKEAGRRLEGSGGTGRLAITIDVKSGVVAVLQAVAWPSARSLDPSLRWHMSLSSPPGELTSSEEQTDTPSRS